MTCVFQSALQSSPWGLMQALEQQVGELRVDGENDGACDVAPTDASDSRPSSGNVWQSLVSQDANTDEKPSSSQPSVTSQRVPGIRQAYQSLSLSWRL